MKDEAGMYKLGVYLGTTPYIGGTFQYDQSILNAMDSLPKDSYQIQVFYTNDVWKEYLSAFPFLQKRVNTIRSKHDVLGGAIWKLSQYGLFDVADVREKAAKASTFSKQLDDEGLDLIIFPSQEAFGAMLKTRTVSTIHDLMHRYEDFPEIRSAKEMRVREFLYKNICKASAGVFVDSEIGKKQVLESYGQKYENKIHILPFTPPQYLFQEGEDALPKDFVLPTKFIFYPAQFWEHKNHQGLIRAVAELKKQGLSIQLILVGSRKNAYDASVKLIEELNLERNIHILGYVSDAIMRTLYKRARAMIMPSFLGPTNIPPLEGMVMGCPVAVSRVYAMPWQVDDAGLTFSPDSITEMAETLKRLWVDDTLCKTLSKKGKKRAEYFSQEKFNERFYNIVANVLQQ